MFLPLVLLSIASGVLSEFSFMDDGTHTSLDKSFNYPDEIIARELNIDFNCSSPPSFARVDVQNSTRVPVYFGIPDIPELYDVKPNFWVFGKTVAPSKLYHDCAPDAQFTIPEGYTGYKVNTTENGIFQKFVEDDGRIHGVIFLIVMVNITDVAPVYLVVENPRKINTRLWIGVGSVDVDEELAPEVEDWFNSDTYKATTCGGQPAPSSVSSYKTETPNLGRAAVVAQLVAQLEIR